MAAKPALNSGWSLLRTRVLRKKPSKTPRDKSNSQTPASISVEEKDKTKKKETNEKPIYDFIPWMRNISRSDVSLCYRLMWVLLFLGVLLIFLYEIAFQIGKYFEFEKTFRSKILVNDTVFYPAVTVCFKEMFGSLALRKQFQKETGIPLIARKDWTKLVGFQGRNVNDVWQSLKTSHLIEELEFPSAQRIRPNRTVIEHADLPSYQGICETLDLSANEIKYDYDSTIYFKIKTKDFRIFTDDASDFRIFVHSPLDNMRHSVRDGITIHYGMKVNVLLSYQKLIFMDTASEPCTDAASFDACEDECLDKWLTMNLTCRMPYMQANLPYCNDEQSTIETHRLGAKIFSHPITCPQCPRKCVQETYATIVTPFSTGYQFAEIHLYYENNVFLIYEQVLVYSFVKCVSDVGSMLGIFLGFCLVNILQLLDRTLKTSLVFCKRIRFKK